MPILVTFILSFQSLENIQDLYPSSCRESFCKQNFIKKLQSVRYYSSYFISAFCMNMMEFILDNTWKERKSLRKHVISEFWWSRVRNLFAPLIPDSVFYLSLCSVEKQRSYSTDSQFNTLGQKVIISHWHNSLKFKTAVGSGRLVGIRRLCSLYST